MPWNHIVFYNDDFPERVRYPQKISAAVRTFIKCKHSIFLQSPDLWSQIKKGIKKSLFRIVSP